MNPTEENVQEKGAKVMLAIKSHDFSNVLKSYKREHSATDDEATLVLIQLQRWLTLCVLYPEKNYAIGAKVDAMWHTFILFTKDYERFCNNVAGFFIHHLPDIEGEEQGDIKVTLGEKHKKLEVLERDYLMHFGLNSPAGIWPKPMYHKRGDGGCTSCQKPPACARCSVGMP